MSAVNLRLDDELHAALRRRAKNEGRSVNSVLVAAAEEYLVRHAENERVHQLGVESVQRWDNLLRRLSE